ncbi:hypothetical protein SFC65_19480 [Priestia filamentosa]|uniref:hypothetical protein n=1 Tax=Priestia filamentosa TaxID=1402861 RepID=UPI003982956C
MNKSFFFQPNGFTIDLNYYITHQIVKNGIGAVKLRPWRELSRWDRFEIADLALESTAIKKNYEEKLEIFKQHKKCIAMFIDLRIPEIYARWISDKLLEVPNLRASDYAFYYHFEENKEKDPILSYEDRFKDIGDNDQPIILFKYLRENRIQLGEAMVSAMAFALAQMHREEYEMIAVGQAASMYEVGREELRKAIRKLPYIDIPPENVTPKQMETNYQYLIKYLNRQKLKLDNNLFKAILFVMNGLTHYLKPYSEVLEKASQRHNVSPEQIKKHIKEMNFINYAFPPLEGL